MLPFQRLSAWRRAHALALHVLAVTEGPARSRHAALLDMMRRTALLIPARIASGSAHLSAAGFAAALQQALGAGRSLSALALIAVDLEVLARSDFARLDARADEVCRILSALHRRLAERAALAAIGAPMAPLRTSRPLRPSPRLPSD